MLMRLKTPLLRFLIRERFGQLVTSLTHIKGGEQMCFRFQVTRFVWRFHYSLPNVFRHHWSSTPAPADKELTTAASMLSSKICCHKVSLYLPRSLYNFHILTRCRLWNLSPLTHRSSDAILYPREPDHHLKNISTDGKPIYLPLSLHSFHILIRCPLSNFSWHLVQWRSPLRTQAKSSPSKHPVRRRCLLPTRASSSPKTTERREGGRR